MRRVAALLASLALVCAGLAAQPIKMELRAKTAVRCATLLPFGIFRYQEQAVAPGTLLSPRRTLEIAGRFASAKIAVDADWRPNLGGAVEITESGQIPFDFGARGASCGPHDYLLRLETAKSTRVRVAVNVRTTGGDDPHTNTVARHQVHLFYGDKPLLSVKTNERKSADAVVELPAGKVDFVIRSGGYVATSGVITGGLSHSSSIQIAVSAIDNCRQDSIRQSCSNSEGFVVFERFGGGLMLVHAGLHGRRAGFVVIGTRAWAARLPGTRCLLLTDPMLLCPIVTDVNGLATLHLPRPASGPFRLQVITLLTPGLTATHGLALTCR